MDDKIVVSASSGDNYFSEQALRAGLIANELKRNDMMMNSDNYREAIRREFEKERIREEIIASEIIRRRELEAEVRRELAMERDLAIRRGEEFPLISSVSPWTQQRLGMLDRPNAVGGFVLNEVLPFSARPEVGAFERLPFQRNVEAAAKVVETNRGQPASVTIMHKPMTANLAGIKRKTAENAIGSNITISKKKPPQEWSCALCEVSATNEHGLNLHLEGKKHKAKEAKLNKEAAKNSRNVGKKNKSPIPMKDKKLLVLAKKKKFLFWCADCQIGCHSSSVMNNHCKGKKHMMRMEELKQTGGGTASSTTTHDDVIREEEGAPKEGEGTEENMISEVGEEEVQTEGQEEEPETMESLVDEVGEPETSKEEETKSTDQGNDMKVAC